MTQTMASTVVRMFAFCIVGNFISDWVNAQSGTRSLYFVNSTYRFEFDSLMVPGQVSDIGQVKAVTSLSGNVEYSLAENQFFMIDNNNGKIFLSSYILSAQGSIFNLTVQAHIGQVSDTATVIINIRGPLSLLDVYIIVAVGASLLLIFLPISSLVICVCYSFRHRKRTLREGHLEAVTSTDVNSRRQEGHLEAVTSTDANSHRREEHLEAVTSTDANSHRREGHLEAITSTDVNSHRREGHLEAVTSTDVNSHRQEGHLEAITSTDANSHRQEGHLEAITSTDANSHRREGHLEAITSTDANSHRREGHLEAVTSTDANTHRREGHLEAVTSTDANTHRQEGHLEAITSTNANSHRQEGHLEAITSTDANSHRREEHLEAITSTDANSHRREEHLEAITSTDANSHRREEHLEAITSTDANSHRREGHLEAITSTDANSHGQEEHLEAVTSIDTNREFRSLITVPESKHSTVDENEALGDKLLNTQEQVDTEEGEEVESAMVGQIVEEEEADTTQGMENQEWKEEEPPNTQEQMDTEEGEEVESAMVGQIVEEEEADTTQGMENQSVLLLKDLVNELQEVIDWFYLGMCLKVTMTTLVTIRQDLRNTDECRTRMLETWMNQEEEPAWSKVVTALHEMKKTALAERIGSKYGVECVPEASPLKRGGKSVVPLDMTYIDSRVHTEELPRDLLKALKEVRAWYPLGLYLGIPVEVLQEIKSKHISQKKRARKMITAWMEKEIISWEKLVRALDEVGATNLACRVAHRCGVQVVHKPRRRRPSVEGGHKWESVKTNPEDLTVVFHKEHGGCHGPVWDFSIPEIDDSTIEDEEEQEELASLKDLVSELQDVRDWYCLGLCLGVPFAKLQSIKQDYKYIEERKREVLLAWSDKEKPTWLKVVNVLVDMRNISLANRIAQKYDVPVPHSVDMTEESEGETALLQTGGMKPSLKDLLRELQQVIEWQHLGQLLGLPESDLEEIHEENETTEDCRREMLLLWMEQDPNCTWKKVVDALIEMKLEVLAAQIASRYDVPTPQSIKDLAEAKAEESQEDIPCPEGLQIEGVAMKDLLSELQEVTDWFYFGVCLGVHEWKLKAIMRDYEDTEECKREMLFIWMNREVATWSKVIRALAEIEMERLALAIATKYGVDVPPSLQEALDNLEHDVAEAQKDGITGTEVKDSDKEQEEEKMIPDYDEEGEVKFKDLVNELQEVTDWLALGVYLGLEMSTLMSVKKDRLRTNECRRNMLGIWMKEQEATWSKVVQALVQMKMYRLAVRLASKYKAPIAKSAVDAMQGEMPEGELQILEVVQNEDEIDSESSCDEEEEEIEMKDLIQELEEVTEWDYLGACLGLPEPTLETIRRDHRNAENRKREVLMEWAKMKVPTWRRVLRALLEMGREVLAEKIARKYGIPLPKKVKKRSRPGEEDEQEQPPPMVLNPPPVVYGFNMMDAFWNGNVIQLIAQSNGYPVQIRKGKICGFGPFSGPQSHFTVLTPLGAPRGEILLQNVFWPGTYVAIIGRVFITTKRGNACRLCVHIGPDNLVCFEAVHSPGQYLAISQAGTSLDPRRVNPGCIETKFFVRVHRQVSQYMTTVMTQFGRPSLVNLLQDESIVQLYISEVNMFLGINKFGQVVNTSDFASAETHFKVKAHGMGMFSFISNNNKGYCLLFQEKDTGIQICSFNSATGGGYSHSRIQAKVLQGKGELSLNANFYLRDNPNRTVSFESVAFPNVFLAIQHGTTLLKEFSIFAVNIGHSERNRPYTVTRTAL